MGDYGLSSIVSSQEFLHSLMMDYSYPHRIERETREKYTQERIRISFKKEDNEDPMKIYWHQVSRHSFVFKCTIISSFHDVIEGEERITPDKMIRRLPLNGYLRKEESVTVIIISQCWERMWNEESNSSSRQRYGTSSSFITQRLHFISSTNNNDSSIPHRSTLQSSSDLLFNRQLILRFWI